MVLVGLRGQIVNFTTACVLGWILFVVFVLRWFRLASDARDLIERAPRQEDWPSHIAASANQTTAEAS